MDAAQITGTPDACLVAEDDTESQLALLQTPGFDKRKYLVTASPCLVVLKSQATLDAFAAADAAAAQEQQSYEAEIATNPACKATSMDDAETKILAQRGRHASGY